jgi:hypothetical protein
MCVRGAAHFFVFGETKPRVRGRATIMRFEYKTVCQENRGTGGGRG